MIAPILQFSAYRQLQAREKLFVDGYIHHLEERAASRNERISAALHRAPDPEILQASDGMFDRVLVRAAIHERITEIAAVTEFTPRRVIREFGLLAFSNMQDYVKHNFEGEAYIDTSELTRDQWSAVSEVKTTEIVGKEGAYTKKQEIKLHSKVAALENIAKLMGMYEAGNPHCAAEFSRPVENVELHENMSADEVGEAYLQIKDAR